MEIPAIKLMLIKAEREGDRSLKELAAEIVRTRFGGYVLVAAAATWVLTVLIPESDGTSVYQVVVLLLLACAAMCLKLFEKRPAMKVYIYIGCGFLWLRAAWVICESLFL